VPSPTAAGKLANFENELETELLAFAQEVENWTRGQRDLYWDNDTGSADASITGFVVDVEDPMKNVNRSPWPEARSGIVRSRHRNPPAHYTPTQPDLDPPPPDTIMEVGLSVNTEYAEFIGAERGSDSVVDLLEEALAFNTRALVDHVLNAWRNA